MHSKRTSFGLALTLVLITSTCSLAEDSPAQVQAQKKPNAVKRILRKVRHPFKKVNTAAAETKEVPTEHSALIEVPSNGQPEQPTSTDVQTSNAANDVPGVHTTPGQFTSPVVDENPIPWYHPIKRIMYPVENLAKQSVVLGQQIMRLEAPIASLQPSMLGLKSEMGNVENRMGSMQHSMGGMQGSLTGVRGDMRNVRGDIRGVKGDITGVRSDLGGMRGDIGNVRGDIGGMRGDINKLRKPVEELRGPLEEVSKPVSTVNKQLARVDQDLNDLKTLLGTVLASIYVAAGAICLGTPLGAFYVYKHRKKFFPHTHDHDMPSVKPADTVAVKPENIEKPE